MFLLSLFLCANLFYWKSAIATGDPKEQMSTRPRGVPPQLASFYQERDKFECLDGKKKIPFEQVNDDYCDCADGSDEPGTSACKNGRFYCANLGFRPDTLPSNRVNDFICDCCDGSDEWDSGTECPNICAAQGSKAREEAARQQAVHQSGWTKRVELAKEGGKMLEEKRTELERKKRELEELEGLKQGAEERKKEVEEKETEAKQKQDAHWEAAKKEREHQEAGELFAKMDLTKDSKLTIEEFEKFTELKEKTDEPSSSAETARNVLTTRIFPEGTDSLDRAAFLDKFSQVKEFLRMAKEEKVDKQEKDTDADANADDKEEKNDVKEEREQSQSDHEKDEETIEEEDEPAASNAGPTYDEPTQAVIAEADEARKAFDEIVQKVDKLQTELKDAESFLNFEYGPDHAWAPLKGQCAELSTTQYTYKLCLFDRTVQKDRGGYNEIGLGYWGSWAGPEDNKFAVQKYDHGQTCWNGPERSTLVELQCGDDGLQLEDASEPSKCEYKFVLKAPAACKNPEELKAEHAEL